MRIHFDISALQKSKWHEYALRFLFGGAVTVATGVVAKHFGPVVGGLFLAFPAIFPASVTLIAKHEQEKKRNQGMDGTMRGKKAAGLDARGAVLGSVGLACFAIFVWKLLPVWNAFETLVLALLVWLIVSVLVWQVEQKH